MMNPKNANQGDLTLSALVKVLGMDASQIKYYQSRRLVSPRHSKQNGQVFSIGDVARLRMIARAKAAGYPIVKIESLIGRISPHLSEAAKLKESIDFAGNKYEEMRREQADADALEQINIACDLELLQGYLKELNVSKHQPHMQVPRKSSREGVSPPVRKKVSGKAAPVEAAKTAAKDAAAGSPLGLFRKYRFAAIAAGLFIAAGFIFLVSRPAGVKDDNPVLAAAKDGGEPSGAANEQLADNPQDGAIDAQGAGEEEPGGDVPLFPGRTKEQGLAEAKPGSSPTGEINDLEPLPEQGSEQAMAQGEARPAPLGGPLDTIGAEDDPSELIKRLLSDIQTKYDEQATRSAPPKPDIQATGPEHEPEQEKDALKAVAGVTASLALVKNAKNGAPKKDAAGPKTNDMAAAGEAAEKEPSGDASLAQPSPEKSEPPAEGGETSSDALASLKQSTQKTPQKTAKASASASAAVPVVSGAKASSPSKVSGTTAKKSPAPSTPAKAAKPQKTPQAVTKKPQPPKQTSASPKKPPPKAPAASPLNLASLDPAALDWARKSRDSYQKGDMSETIVSATVSLSIEPGQVQPYIDRALAYKQKGLFDKAIADCNKAMVNDPSNAIAVYTRGVVYQAMGQKQNARIDYAKACVMGFVDACDIQTAQLEKDSVDTLMKQSRQSFRKGDWDAVIAATSDVLKQDPANVVAYVTRSAAYSQKKQFTEAISDCDAALKVDPDYALAYNNRGYAREQLKKTDQARQDYEKACALGLKLGCQNYEKF